MSQKDNAPARKASGEIVKKAPDFKVEELATITSFDDAIAFLKDSGVEVVSASDVLSDGFEGVEKSDLVNVPFIILRVMTTMSKEFNSPMVIIHALTGFNKRVRFTDGSTGILGQIKFYTERTGKSPVGMFVPKGLLSSSYTPNERDSDGNVVLDEFGAPKPLMNNGKEVVATTYYLNTDK
jgi:hypothetical protein